MGYESDVALSVNQVPIRLTAERWQHIVDGHEDLHEYQTDVLSVIEDPDAVFQGRQGSFIAVRSYGRRGLLAVFYREVAEEDGFIITARFMPKQPARKKLWSRK